MLGRAVERLRERLVPVAAEWLRERLGPSTDDLDYIESLEGQVRELEARIPNLIAAASRRSEKTTLEADVELLRAELNCERNAHSKTQSTLDIKIKYLTELVESLTEPPDGAEGQCQKVRLRTREDAEAFARKVERETGRPEGSLKAYRCTGANSCPRQPITLGAFFHIANADPRMRTSRDGGEAAKAGRVANAREARRSGRLVGQRLNDDVLQSIRDRLGDDALDAVRDRLTDRDDSG